MNDKELLKTIQNDIKNIDELKNILTMSSEIDGHDFSIKRAITLLIKRAITVLEQLDEPVVQQELEKPIVPQFVADWYEEHKDNFEIYISELCINFTCHRERLNDKLANWYEQLENKPIQTLVNMHQFGYEIKKDKKAGKQNERQRTTKNYPKRYQKH